MAIESLARTASLLEDSDIVEVFIWGIFIVIAVIVMFIVKRLIRQQIDTRIRNTHRPLGMDTSDLDTLKEKGDLSEEEWKAIRQTLARKIVERAQEEERLRAEKEGRSPLPVTRGTIEGLRRQTPAAQSSPDTEQGETPAAARKAPLPDRLKVFAEGDDEELEKLLLAGFLTPDDVRQIRDSREES